MLTKIREIANKIFRPHDGSIRAVHVAVSESILHTESEADKLVQTVRELMIRNDVITGRINKAKHNVQKFSK